MWLMGFRNHDYQHFTSEDAAVPRDLPVQGHRAWGPDRSLIAFQGLAVHTPILLPVCKHQHSVHGNVKVLNKCLGKHSMGLPYTKAEALLLCANTV